jgi:hypothetical protein
MTEKVKRDYKRWGVTGVRSLHSLIEGTAYEQIAGPLWARKMQTESRMIAWSAWIAGKALQPTDAGGVDLTRVE